MATPTSPSAFQRPDLGQAYMEFDLMSHINGFIGLRLLPWSPTEVAQANFSKVPLEQLLLDGVDLKRAPGAGYARQEWEFEQDNYVCEESGSEELLDDRNRAAYGYTGIRFEQISTNRAVARLLRALETEIQAIVQDSTTYASQVTGVTTEWDTIASSTPVEDVLAGRESFKGSCGMYPNTLVMSEKVASVCVQSAQIQDYIKYTAVSFENLPGQIIQGGMDVIAKTSQLLAMAFRIPNVVISPAVRNSANPGQSATIADIWDDEFVTLLLSPQSDDLQEPGFGRTFGFQDLVVEQYRDETVRSDVIRARHDIDVKVIQGECLWILNNIHT